MNAVTYERDINCVYNPPATLDYLRKAGESGETRIRGREIPEKRGGTICFLLQGIADKEVRVVPESIVPQS